MRDISFRAWNTRLKIMEDISDLYWFEENMCHQNGDNDYVLQQSTGLVDSNGKDIYEGDMCYAFKSNSYLDGVYEVTWHEAKGRWYYKNQPTYKDLYQVGSGGNSVCRVIGNIFEGLST